MSAWAISAFSARQLPGPPQVPVDCTLLMVVQVRSGQAVAPGPSPLSPVQMTFVTRILLGTMAMR